MPAGNSRVLLRNIDWRAENVRAVSSVNVSFASSADGVQVDLKDIGENIPAICIACGG